MKNLKVQPSFQGLPIEDWLDWTQCIRQGGNESTWRWNTIMAYFFSMLHPAWVAGGFGLRVSDTVTITHLVWSDNIYLIAKSMDEWIKMFTTVTASS